MAESVANVIDMDGTHVLDTGSIIISSQDIDGSVVTGVEVTDEDIIQQALDEATGTFVQSGVEYTSGADPNGRCETELIDSVVTNETFSTAKTSVVGESNMVIDEPSNTVFDGTTNESLNEQLVEDAFNENNINIQESEAAFTSSEYSVVNSQESFTADSMNSNNIETLNGAQVSGANLPPVEETQNLTNNSEELSTTIEGSNVLKLDSSTGRISVTLMPSNQTSGAPLGSSQNPIRIIQQGNQYTPMQNLSSEQLHQIMQVVQQQQVAQKSTAEGSSILFNPQTNTRIVYRVIYPSELHKNATSAIKLSGLKKQSQGQQTQTVILSRDGQRRQYKKRMRDEEEDKYDGPDLTKEEKEERKKHRPRTRSGRISKPPKHMVKDYKHIHVLDMEEEEAADDSDGGYSDFKYSEGEEDENDHVIDDQEDIEYEKGSLSGKPKHYRCSVCHKAYVGLKSLERHFRLNPDHASDGQISTAINADNASTLPGSQNGFNSAGNMSEDSNTQDSVSSTPSLTASTVRGFHHRRGTRGRPPGIHTAMRRSAKLREIVKQCRDEDLIEVVLPRLAKVMSLWEFLLKKVERGRPARPHVEDIYTEFHDLTKQVQKICESYLQPSTDKSVHTLKVEEEKIANVLGLNVGVYDIKDMPPSVQEQTGFQYKVLTSNPSIINTSQSPFKRKTDGEEHLLSPAKKLKASDLTSISSSSQIATASNTFTVVHPQSVISNKKISLATTDSAISSLSLSSASTMPIVIHPISPSTMSKAVAKVKSQGPVSIPQNISSQRLLISQSEPSAPIIVQKSRSPQVPQKDSPIVVQTLPHHILSGGVSLLHPNRTVPPAKPTIPSNVTQTGGTKLVRIVSSEGLVMSETPSVNVVSTEMSNTINSAVNSSNTCIQVISHSDMLSQAASPVAKSEPPVAQSTTNAATTDSQTTTDLNVVSVQEMDNKMKMQFQNDEESFVTTDLIGSSEENVLTPEVVASGAEESASELIVTNSDEIVNSSESIQTVSDVVTDNSEVTQSQENGEMVQYIDQSSLDVEGQEIQGNQIITASNIYQTPDGFIIIQNEDGSTVQLQGGDGEPIPLETVQALLAMDTEGQILQATESETVQ